MASLPPLELLVHIFGAHSMKLGGTPSYTDIIDTPAFKVKARLGKSSDDTKLAFKFVIRADDTKALLDKHSTAYESDAHEGCYSLVNEVPESVVVGVGGLRKHVERLFSGYTVEVAALDTLIKDSCAKMNITLL